MFAIGRAVASCQCASVQVCISIITTVADGRTPQAPPAKRPPYSCCHGLRSTPLALHKLLTSFCSSLVSADGTPQQLAGNIAGPLRPPSMSGGNEVKSSALLTNPRRLPWQAWLLML